MVVAIPRDFSTLYPPAAEQALDLVAINSVYDRLADIGNNLNTVGDSGFVKQLAANWQWASDSLSIAFALRPDARWHDDQPVRADDVQFSFRAYTDTTSDTPNGGYLSNIDSVSVRDSLTAVVWFKRRMPQQFFQATYNMYIIPAHIFGRMPAASAKSSDAAANPVGSGRFRFVSWDKAQRLELAADIGNYRSRAKLDRLVFAVSDVAGATLSVFAGNADFYEKLQPEDLASANTRPDLRVIPYSQAGYSFLTFNLHARKDADMPHPVLSDVRVRRALTMAVNRPETVRMVLDSFGTPSLAPAPRVMFPDADKLTQIQFNVAGARALLDSAGWLLAPGKEVRSKNGVPLTFDILVANTSKPRQTYARFLEQQFRGVGVGTTVRVLEGSALGQKVTTGDFDAYMGALTVTPGLQALPQSWGTPGIGKNGKNYGGYSNRAFDATVDSALAAFRTADANALWGRAFQIILNDAPAIWLFEETNLALAHIRIRGIELRPDAWYVSLADWSIDPSQFIRRDRQAAGAAR